MTDRPWALLVRKRARARASRAGSISPACWARTTARWKVIPLPQPADWRNDRGLKLAIRTDRPRADAGVYVAVREADGSWYYHAWASDLTEARNEGIALFEDFSPPEHMSPPEGGYFDENGRLDLDQVLKTLGEHGITRLLVEGGPTVAASFVAENLVDEALLLRSEKTIGEDGIGALEGMPLEALTGRLVSRGRERLGADMFEDFARG